MDLPFPSPSRLSGGTLPRVATTRSATSTVRGAQLGLVATDGCPEPGLSQGQTFAAGASAGVQLHPLDYFLAQSGAGQTHGTSGAVCGHVTETSVPALSFHADFSLLFFFSLENI